MKQTRIIEDTTMTHDHHLILVAFIMSIIGTPIRATTTGRMPLNARIMYSLSLNEVKNIATIRMIRKAASDCCNNATLGSAELVSGED